MSVNARQPDVKIVLVSAPWPLYKRPSIQIGTLKSYLRSRFPDVTVDARHIYLEVAASVGYRNYQAISKRTWLAEAVYGALLYPGRCAAIEKLFRKQAARNPVLRAVDFKALTSRVKSVTDAFIDSVNWGDYNLAGFSICLCQLTASIYFIRQIKSRFPGVTVVAGGSTFAGEAVKSVFEAFPEIDVVINGEGEIPLSRLVGHLKDGGSKDNIPPIAGVITPEVARSDAPVSFEQMQSLDALKRPDYDDYFSLLKSLGPQNAFFPTLPAEASRGCWWRKTCSSGAFRGCAFCNLNLQWEGYRSRDPSEVVSEIDELTTRHKTLSVAFVDNLLPQKTSGDIFEKIDSLGKDLRVFGEIRATTPLTVLKTMRRAGVDEIQIGIEALSTRLLKKMNKGTTAIENLEIMKHCEALGILSASNLILCFPGSDPEDVAETLRCLEFALPYRPLRSVRFWLGFGSPVWSSPGDFGIKAAYNHPGYAALFPREIYKAARFTVQAYRGDLGYQKRIWRPVAKKLESWKQAYAELRRGRDQGPILGYRDGREFIIIRQRLPGAEPLLHRLEGTSRAIYLFCEHHRTIKSILNRFQGFTADKMVPFLQMMVEKKLMFEEDGKYLSLAVPIHPRD